MGGETARAGTLKRAGLPETALRTTALQLLEDGAEMNPQPVGRAGAIAAFGAERGRDDRALAVEHGLGEGETIPVDQLPELLLELRLRRRGLGRLRKAARGGEPQIGGIDERAHGKQGGPFHAVPQLASAC